MSNSILFQDFLESVGAPEPAPVIYEQSTADYAVEASKRRSKEYYDNERRGKYHYAAPVGGWEATDTWEAIQRWSAIPKKIQNKLKKAYPDIADIKNDLSAGHPEAIHVMKMPHEHTIRFLLTEPAGNLKGLQRYYEYNDGGLLLADFIVKRKGQGTARQIMAGADKVARKLGLKYLRLEAAYDGSFVWAKAGFKPYGPYIAELKGHVYDELGKMVKQKQLSKEDATRLKQYIDNDDLVGFANDPAKSATGNLAAYDALVEFRWGGVVLIDGEGYGDFKAWLAGSNS